MIRITFNKPLLLVVCLWMAIAIISSCKKDSIVKSDKVELLSFGPTGAKHGENIIFIGNNLDKVTEVDLAGATIPAASFTEHTSEHIVFVIPASALQGYATLKTPAGDVVSKTQVNFEVPVVITSIPKSARPGENITIKGNYMNWVKEVWFSKDISETTFVSRSLTELVITVPMNAQTGKLNFNTGGTKGLTIESDSELVITMPAITSFSPIPIDKGGELTITGTDLDLTMGVLFKGITTPVTTFVSKSATELIVKVPATANKGKISLVAYSGLMVESASSLLFIGDLPDLAPVAYAFYEDDLANNWQDWGWNRTADYKNADNVRDGVASIKMNYTGDWGGLKFANQSVSTAAYTELTFSIYGTPGTGGKKIHVTPSGGSTYDVIIEEGKWIEYKVSKTQLGNPATITDLLFQNEAWAGIVYIDHVGLR